MRPPLIFTDRICYNAITTDKRGATMKKIDFHVHHSDNIPLADTVQNFRDMCKRKGYVGICTHAYVRDGATGYHPDCNEAAMALKQAMPEAYAFAALHHERDLVAQAKEYMAAGFDGIKLLEGKPNTYRYNGFGYEAPTFEAFFAYAEEAEIPLMIHNNDPISHWSIETATPRAIEMGWVYDETYPSQEWFFAALEDVLHRHPRLRAALAHMGFYADKLPRAAALLDACPNLYLDITPAPVIYEHLSATPEESRAFFEKYHERLIYGTDAQNDLTGFAREYNDTKTDIISTFLEGSTPRRIGKYDIHPIGLPTEMLENIYYNNAMRFVKKEGK